jgi:hypothetical protein
MVVPTVWPLSLHPVLEINRRLSYICTALFCTDDLMNPHSSVRVVRKWCGLCTDLVH